MKNKLISKSCSVMRCAYSFMSVLVLVIGVGIAAFIVILATEDLCPDTYVRCVEDGKCISKNRFCNRVQDCLNGSDEIVSNCVDLTGLEEFIRRQFSGLNTSKNSSVTKANLPIDHNKIILQNFPKGCRLYNDSGTLCDYQNWTKIPWDKFDIHSSKLRLNQVVKTDELNLDKQFSNLSLSVKSMYLENNEMLSLKDGSLCHMKKLRWLDLTNNSIKYIGQNAFCQLEVLTWLDLKRNELQLKHYRFRGMPALHSLFLQYNQIGELSDHIFRELKSLGFLNLKGNLITYISARAFRYNLELIELNLSNNCLRHFAPLTLVGQTRLQILYIGYNEFSHLPKNIFSDLKSIKSLYLEDIEIDETDVDLFQQTPKLDFVNFTKFQYCRLVPKVSRCYPVSDGLSSLENLLVGKPLRMVVWIVAVLTIIGNIAILITRTGPYLTKKRPTILDIFVNNLAGADFLMGIYLLTLAVKDVQFRNSYILHAYTWSTSKICSAIGVLAMISSEVSILILTLMSMERYVVISRPFAQEYKLSKTQARIAVGIIWVFVITLALVPAFQWTGRTSFYGSTGICFPMHLDDPYSFGWQYTTFVFIGVNSICLGLITLAYGSLFFEIRKTRPTNPAAVRDMEMAIRLFFTVGTDFVCWAPIIVLKILVLNGYQLPKQIISWVLIFVLPLNSAINPFLYTFSTGEIRVKLLQYFTMSPKNTEGILENIPLPCLSQVHPAVGVSNELNGKHKCFTTTSVELKYRVFIDSCLGFSTKLKSRAIWGGLTDASSLNACTQHNETIGVESETTPPELD